MPRCNALTYRGSGAMYRYTGASYQYSVAMYRDLGALHLSLGAFILSNGAVERSGVFSFTLLPHSPYKWSQCTTRVRHCTDRLAH